MKSAYPYRPMRKAKRGEPTMAALRAELARLGIMAYTIVSYDGCSWEGYPKVVKNHRQAAANASAGRLEARWWGDDAFIHVLGWRDPSDRRAGWYHYHEQPCIGPYRPPNLRRKPPADAWDHDGIFTLVYHDDATIRCGTCWEMLAPGHTPCVPWEEKWRKSA